MPNLMRLIRRTKKAGRGTPESPAATGGAKGRGTAPRRSSGIRRWKLILFSLVVVLVVFGVAEAVLRAVLPAPAYLEARVYPELPGDLAPSQEVPGRAETWGPGATHANPGVDPDGMRFVMTSTAEGFRGPSARVEDPRLRILCLGDSSMMGYLVPDWDTFPAQLIARLRDSYGPWTEALNAGVIGYTIDDELEYMRDKGLALKPDIVVLEIFANDVLEKDTRPKETLRQALRVRWPLSAVGPDIDNWGLVRGGRMLAARLFHFPIPAEPVERVHDILEPGRDPAMFDAYEKTFREFDALLAEHHIPLVILLSPHHIQVYPWGEYAGSDVYQRRMSRMAEGLHARWVDLLPAFRERIRSQPDLYIGNGMYDTHQSAAGQRVKLDAAWPVLREEFSRLGFDDLGLYWKDSPAGDRWKRRPSLWWGRTWTGKNDAPGIEVRPPAKSSIGPINAPPGTEFRCEIVGGPYADQCRIWLTVDDDDITTRIVEMPVVGAGEVQTFNQPVTSGKGGAVRLEFLANWTDGFHADEKTDLKNPPIVLRRPLFLPVGKEQPAKTVSKSKSGGS